MSRPLLVVAHEATRTGSPRVLIELLRHARPRMAMPIAIRLQAGGPLSEELISLADTTSWHGGPAAVLVNGSSAASAIDHLDGSTPTALYVHEEGNALAVLPTECKDALPRFDVVMCVSERSREDLIRLGVTPDRVIVMPPVVALAERVDIDDLHRRGGLLEGLAPGIPIVVGCGEATWRKGADLFIDVARRTIRLQPTVFVWTGRRPRSYARLLDNDTNVMGMDDSIIWTGEITDVTQILARADVLVMTSREDPHPLVPLEAAAQATPTAGFAVGGLADLGRLGHAETVPFPDTAALAEAICNLLGDSSRRARLAARSLSFANAHNSIEVVGQQFMNVISRLVDDQWR